LLTVFPVAILDERDPNSPIMLQNLELLSLIVQYMEGAESITVLICCSLAIA
jgi:hypothetical protein